MLEKTKQDVPLADVSLDKYRARLGFWQAIWGTLISGGVAVAIPAMVDAYKANLDLQKAKQEVTLKNKELEGKILDNHQNFVSSFLNTALNQDIELRLRFSEYFSYLSDKEDLIQWQKYHESIERRRDSIRDSINSKEKELIDLRSLNKPSAAQQADLLRTERELKWNYAEVGYIRQDTNVTGPANFNLSPAVSRTEIIAENEILFNTAIIDQDQVSRIEAITNLINSNISRYQSVEKATGVPWYVVGILHQIETGGSFTTNLINGDPLTARTSHVPAGHPIIGSPPFTWEEAAIDAMLLSRLGHDKENFQSIGSILYLLEQYNGFGYRTRRVKSPFIWSCTSVYTSGRFVSDSTFDATAKISFCGVVALLKVLNQRGIVQLPSTPAQKS